MRSLYLSLLYGLIHFDKVESSHLRHEPLSAKLNVEVFDVAPDGEETPVLTDADTRVHEVLCSAKVISRLERCEDPESAASETTSEKLYPMSEAYEAAVAAGHACPLPAPFMIVRASRCCVGSDPNVWPNFCPDASTLIGTNIDSSIWSVGGSVHVIAPAHLENAHQESIYQAAKLHVLPSVVTPGVFRIGRPDIPQHYSRWKPNLGVLLTYFISGVAWVCLAVYIQGWLDDETSILRGQNRERLLTEMKANDESDDDSVSSVGSLSPAHGLMGLSEAGKVSMAFGLLPSNPRARSTNSSTMNTPRP